MTENENTSHILVVDDDPDVCHFLTHIWRSEGFQVSCVFCGDDALSIVRDSLSGKVPPFDLILLDVLMPGIDGIETCRQIRSELGLTSLPIIMLTALNEFQSRIDALEAGANDYLIKPFTTRELKARALNLIRLSRETCQRVAAEDSLMRRHQELTALYKANEATSNELDLEKMLAAGLSAAQTALDLSIGCVLLQASPGQVAFQLCQNFPAELVGFAARASYPDPDPNAKHLNIILDMQKDPVPFPAQVKSIAVAAGIHTLISIPLFASQEPRGQLIVGSPAVREFGPGELSLLQAIGQQLGSGIERIQLYDETRQMAEAERQRAEELSAIHHAALALEQSLDLDTVLDVALDVTTAAIHSEAIGCIFLLDPKSQLLEIAVHRGMSPDFACLENPVLLDECLCGRAAATGEMQISLGSDSQRHTRPCKHKDWNHLSIPLNSRDQVVGVLCVYQQHDVPLTESQIRVLETESQHLGAAVQNAQLFAETEQALEKLRTVQSQLVQAERLRVLAEIAGGVAHDFNNLLTIISAQVDELRPIIADNTEAQAYLEAIIQAAQDGAETVRRVLEFGREREGAQFTPVDINQVIKETVQLTRSQWQSEPAKRGAPIELETTLSSQALVVSGNPSQLREVLTNLILNAVQAMPTGGKLKIETQSKHECAIITLQDTGVGMAPDIQQRIFEPFFTTRGSQGSGLGLTVSQSILIGHGGRIKLVSEPGQGSTFTIRLPLDQDHPSVLAAWDQTPNPNSQARILVIDDQYPVVKFLHRVLQAKGYTVATAANGTAGISEFESNQYDLVLVDLGLPDISGWEVIRRLQQHNPVPIVLMSGWTSDFTAKDLKKAGIEHVLQKPFEIEELLQVVQAMSIPSEMPL